MDILKPGYFLDDNFVIDKANVPTKVSTKTGLEADHIDQYSIEMYQADQRGGEGRTTDSRTIKYKCKRSIRFYTWKTDMNGPYDPLIKRHCVLNKYHQRWVPNSKDPIYLRRVLHDTRILLYDVVENPDKYNGINVLLFYRQLIEQHIKPIYCGADVSEVYLNEAEVDAIVGELRLHMQHQQGIATLRTLHQEHEQEITTLTGRVGVVENRLGQDNNDEGGQQPQQGPVDEIEQGGGGDDGDIDDSLDAFYDAVAEEVPEENDGGATGDSGNDDDDTVAEPAPEEDVVFELILVWAAMWSLILLFLA